MVTADPAPTGPSPASPRKRHDALIAFGVIAACLGLIVVLRFISKDSASAGRSLVVGLPTPAVTAAQGCQNFADFWMSKDGIAATADQIEAISNCRLADNGKWVVPTSARDPRLNQTPVLSDDQRAATANLRADILDQLNDLDAAVPTTLRTWLSQIYDPFPRAVIGHVRDGVSIRTQRNRYNRLAQAYLIGSSREALANYVGWVMERRIDAYDQIKTKCQTDPDVTYLRNACLGLEDNLSIRVIPFTWDLRDSYLLDSYLATVDPTTIQTSAVIRKTGPE